MISVVHSRHEGWHYTLRLNVHIHDLSDCLVTTGSQRYMLPFSVPGVEIQLYIDGMITRIAIRQEQRQQDLTSRESLTKHFTHCL